jgi:tripartite-type tricarboxylate transporter receptor subunit TctC
MRGSRSPGALTVPQAAQAQAWPSKGPIRLVAVFPPGGSVDQVSRILAPVLQQSLGQTVVVENKGGASGAIGTSEVARAEPDGHTWGVVFDTHGVNPALQPRIAFDTRRDLTTVAHRHQPDGHQRHAGHSATRPGPTWSPPPRAARASPTAPSATAAWATWR